MRPKRVLESVISVSVLFAFSLPGCGGDEGATGPDREAGTGRIIIDQFPEALAGAGWSLSGPQDAAGSGDTTMTGMTGGTYTLTWDDVGGYSTPDGGTLALAAGDSIEFAGEYMPGDFVLVQAGVFTMGSPLDEAGRFEDETQHQVTLTRNFHMSVTEVTNSQFAELAQWAYDRGYCYVSESMLLDDAGGTFDNELLNMQFAEAEISFNGVTFEVMAGKEEHPVSMVTWFGAAAYCDWLSMRDGLPVAYDHETWICNGGDVYGARGYRLPTEAEWEYACRAGTMTPFNTGGCLDPDTEANYDYNYPYDGCPQGTGSGYTGSTMPAGSYPANAFGLSDMHGNLLEWCYEFYGAYSGDVTDPTGPDFTISEDRVVRGGYYGSPAGYCRSACRAGRNFMYRFTDTGFRPVRTAE